MIDIKRLRDDPNLYKKNYKKLKKPEHLTKVDRLVEKEKLLRELKYEVDQLRSKRNTLSQEINRLRKEEKNADAVMKKVKTIPNKIKKAEDEYKKTEIEVNEILDELPNLIHEKVPYGKTEKDNVEIKTWGKKRKFTFPVKNHVELLESLDLVDFEASAKVSGNGFYYLKGDLALLNQALIRFVMDLIQSKGYVYIEGPLLIRKNVLSATIDVNDFEASIYEMKDDDTVLIGTSEHSLLALHKEQVIDVPKKYYSYSMCFRKEIGAHGINEKGLWRTHQFNKVEQVIFCSKENSWKYFDELLRNSEDVFRKLKIPYRLLEICTADLSKHKARQIDIEVYRPTTEDYGEVVSLSNCTDYQARKLNIRYEEKNGREVVHALNDTAVATSRALVAIVEHYQQKDGSIKIPVVLQPYMNGKTIIKKE